MVSMECVMIEGIHYTEKIDPKTGVKEITLTERGRWQEDKMASLIDEYLKSTGYTNKELQTIKSRRIEERITFILESFAIDKNLEWALKELMDVIQYEKNI